MTIGTSLFLIAVGALLKYAITDDLSGIDLRSAGVILMVVGVVGLVIGLGLTIRDRSASGAPPELGESTPPR
jgi:hypothetical protein